MSQIDYPDFIRVDQWVGDPWVNVAGQVFASPHTFGPFFAAPWEAVALYLFVNVGGTPNVQINVRWWNDQAMTQHIVDQFRDTAPNGQITEVFPVMGPWVSIDYTVTAAGGVSTLLAQPRRGFHAAARPFPTPTLIAVVNQAIGAGGTLATPCNATTSGRAILSVSNVAATTWNATLDVITPAGVVVYRIVTLDSATVGKAATVAVALPGRLTQLQINNTGAAGANFYASLIVDITP